MGKQKGKHFTQKAKKEKKDKKKEKIEKIEEPKVETIKEEKIEKKKSKHPILKGFLVLIILGILVVARRICVSNK